MTDGVLLLDREWRCRYVNPRTERLGRKSREELLGRSVWEAFPETLTTPFYTELHRAMAERVPVEYEYYCDALQTWFHDRAIPHPRGLLVLVQDITPVKRVEEALLGSREQVRAIFDEAAIGIARLDLSGNVLESNRALQQMLGYTGDELRRIPADALIHPEDRAIDGPLYRELLQGKRTHYRVERRYVRKDGKTVWGRQIGSVVRDAEGAPRFLIGMLEDITQRKEFEAAMEQTELRLRQMQRLEAIGRLAGGVAHDFNNILAVINGYADLLLGLVPEASPLRSGLVEIRKAGERSAGLTRQLLAFSREQILTPQPLHLGRVIADAESLLRRLAGERVQLVIEVEPDLGLVEADPTQMEQVLMNLVINARDAMPGGGTLTLRAANFHGSGPGTDPLAPAGRAWVRMTVADTGHGMDEETASHIFEPFFTTKPAGKGTGLGLSTVYGIVRQSNGSIDVETAPGEGTTFQICLPLLVPPARPDNGQPRQGTTARTVLVIDSEQMVRGLIRSVLESNGYSVLEAGDPVEAERVAAGAANLDLVITETGGSGSGWPAETADSLPRPGTALLLMSGETGPARLESPESAVGVLEKPFSSAALMRKVRDALGDDD